MFIEGLGHDRSMIVLRSFYYRERTSERSFCVSPRTSPSFGARALVPGVRAGWTWLGCALPAYFGLQGLSRAACGAGISLPSAFLAVLSGAALVPVHASSRSPGFGRETLRDGKLHIGVILTWTLAGGLGPPLRFFPGAWQCALGLGAPHALLVA